MLSLSRREGESIEIYLGDYVDPSTPVGKVFVNGPLLIRVFRIRPTDVRLAIDAPPGLTVMGKEVADDQAPASAATWPDRVADKPRRTLRLRAR